MLKSEQFVPVSPTRKRGGPRLRVGLTDAERFATGARCAGKVRPSLALRPPIREDNGTAAIVMRWAVLAMLAAQLLFAHGCHGDEDHELLAVIQRMAER